MLALDPSPVVALNRAVAVAAYEAALERADNAAERAFLERRLRQTAAWRGH